MSQQPEPDPGDGAAASLDKERFRRYLEALQDRICAALEGFEPAGDRFVESVEPENEGDGAAMAQTDRQTTSWSRVLSGETFERAALHRTRASAPAVPPSLLERRPELRGSGFTADSLSLIVHPKNPYIPTVHANLRCFVTQPRRTADESGSADQHLRRFWFGGGFDLTPCYGFEEDARHWHRIAEQACAPFGSQLYPTFKRACDEYFFLPHRHETRGIGGLFFDDLDSLDLDSLDPDSLDLKRGGQTSSTIEQRFERCRELVESVGDHLLPAYLPLVERRITHPYGERERSFQSYRRGRYVEFNLLYDRGTRYGLQAGRRTESILSSLPPRAEWRYRFEPEPGTAEAELTERFLRPRDWLV